MIVTVTGASGFIGPHLIARLQSEGHQVHVLGRRPPQWPGVRFTQWTADTEPSPEALTGSDAVIHLAGEPVAQRWSAEVQRRIRDSRVDGTRNLVSAIARLAQRPRILLSGSAVGYYGDRADEILTEASLPGRDFLAGVCIDWERESMAAATFGTRVVVLRTGIALGAEGGALKQMLGPFRAGIGGPVGSGKQWVSWIHVEDVVGLILFALNNETVSGALNVTAPEPVRNTEFAHALGNALGRPSLIHTPAFGLKLMFGKMAEAVLASQRAVPVAAAKAGYRHRFPDLSQALGQILR